MMSNIEIDNKKMDFIKKIEIETNDFLKKMSNFDLHILDEGIITSAKILLKQIKYWKSYHFPIKEIIY